jgi:dihydroorotate dehydrogenase (fumarate)
MDLSTIYMGLELKNPLVAGASPLSREVDTVRVLEDAGVAAVVMYSLFEEQIEHEAAAHAHFEELGTERFAESLTYFPSVDLFPRGPHDYLEHITAIKKAVDIPVIASLNGTSTGGWTEYARMMQEAGADALELNVYLIATDANLSGQQIESRYFAILDAVKRTVKIPVAMKLSPFFSSLPNFARQLDEHGADGLVLFNRFYQPEIDLETLELKSDIVFSGPHKMRLPLRWIAILDPMVKASLAASSGVYTHEDVLKLMMAGADVTQMVAALLRDGPQVIGEILRKMTEWMEDHDYESIRQMQGSMNHKSVENPAGFVRANYMKALQEYQ